MFIQLIIVFLVLWLFIFKCKRRHFDRLYQQLKISKPRIPFIGHLYIFFCNQEEIMSSLQWLGREAIKAGGINSFWGPHKLYIHVADPNVAEILLKTCLEKDDVMKCFHIATGDGSIFASVKIWRPRRKYLAPTFSMTNLNYFVKSFCKQSGVLVEKLQGVMGTDPISLWKFYSLYSIDAISESLGFEVNGQKNTYHLFLVAIDEVLNNLTTRVFKPWLYSDFVYKRLPCYHNLMKHKPVVFSFIDKGVKEKREQNESYRKDLKNSTLPVNNRPKTFMDLMIEAGDLDDLAIREESIVILGAASDTSAVGLGFTSMMLATHPEVQEEVYREIIKVIGDVSKPISVDHLPQLKYLDAVIRESLRLYPPVPIIARKILQDVELPSGVTLLAGCGIIINIWAINRNPAHWGEDADQFRPDRFLDPTPRHPAAFCSFSHGPRNCLGFQYAMMSMKTVLATLLRQYRISPSSDDFLHEPLRVKYDIMMRNVDNYSVKIEPRK